MRFHFNRSNLPEENLSKYIRTLNLAIEFASLNIAITATYYSQLLYLDGVLEFRTHIFSSKIVYHELPEFDASTPSESAVLQSHSKVAPKWNSIEFGSAHESGAPFGPGLKVPR